MTRLRPLSRLPQALLRLLPPSLAKRLLLLPLLGANAAFAQYCEIDFDTIEPITRVQFGEFDNAVVGSEALEDFTNMSIQVFPGETYDIVIEGDTAGEYENWLSVFIDWDQDGAFTGSDERYDLDEPLEDSTGSDGQQVTRAIIVPITAANGTTRMRVVKKYYEPGEACGDHDYGQAEDYSLLVGEPSETAPVVTQTISPQNALAFEAFALDLTNYFEDRSDANTLTFTATGLPTGVTLDAGSGVLGGAPEGIGTYSIVVKATNPGGEHVSATFTLRVEPAPEDFAGGNGSAANPWQVATAAQLYALRHESYGYYFELVADIALDMAPWNVDGGWLPIGDEVDPFMGVLHGNGHRITGLTIDRPGVDEVGLFGSVWYASIDDVHLDDVSISGGEYVGALGGSLNGTVVSNSSASGSVTGESAVGGLVGALDSGSEISASGAGGLVTGSEDAAGGLVGSMYQSEITDSHAHATVVADTYGGGLVGDGSWDSIIRRSHAVGTVSVNDYGAGGLLGRLTYGGELHDSYAWVNVSSDYYVGGILGEAWGSNVANTYAVGSVSSTYGDDAVGALIGHVVSYAGEDQADIRDSFWSTDHAGGLDAYGDNDNNSGGVSQFDNLVGLSQAQMQDDAVFVAAGWNFDSVWAIAPGSYPYHVLFGVDDDGSGSGGDDDDDGGSGDDEDDDDSGSSPSFSGGTGDLADPWQVSSAEQLDELRNFLDAHFVLTADIDLGTAPWNTDGGWLPIGDDHALFHGSLDGNGHTITGLTIDRPGVDYVGLFGYVWNGRISDVHLEDVSVNGRSYVGALAGMLDDSTVSDSSVSGTVRGGEQGSADYAGGLVGFVAYGSSVSDSAADVTVSGDYYVGGLAGGLETNSEITGSSASGSVTGNDYATGGLVGTVYDDSEIADSHAHVSVIAETYGGGLVGTAGGDAIIRRSHAVGTVAVNDDAAGGLAALLSYGAELHDSYAHVNVSGADYVGGLVGEAYGGHVSNTYVIGSVSGNYYVGALIGSVVSSEDDYTDIRDSFWNTDHAGDLDAYGENVNYEGAASQFDNLVGLSQAQMQDDAVFVAAGWNFGSVWAMAPGSYPYHVLFGADNDSGGGDDDGDDDSSAPFSGGTGNLADPWQVSSAEQLDELRNFLDAHFVLTADIDLGTAPWNEAGGWLPIGDDAAEFRGSLDGNGYTITGLTIDRPDTEYVGLFGQAWYASITDLRLEDVSVTGGSFTGALVGMAGGTEVSDAFVSGNITSEQEESEYVGGLVGYAGYESLISNSEADVTVAGLDYAGGLVGALFLDAVVEESYATGSVTGSYAVGGLVGDMYNRVEINDSHAHATVVGDVRVGGLVGSVQDGVVRRSHAVGSVTGSEWLTGGLLGILAYGGELHDGYAHASVSGGTNVGGLVGDVWGGKVTNSYVVSTVSGSIAGGLVGSVYSTEDSRAELSDSYWSTDHAGSLSAYAENENDGASSIFSGLAGHTQTALRSEATYDGWNFDSIWAIEPGFYPYHAAIGSETTSSTAPPIPDQYTLVEGTLSLDVSAAFYDPDHAVVGYYATGLPSGVTIDNNGIISGAPAAAGSYTVAIMAMYDGAGPRTGSVVINVLVFAGGAGTLAEPWEIGTAGQLHAMRDFPDAHFVLTADIDLGGEAGPFANGGAGWAPIGGDTLGDPFTGSFDGGGHVIGGLYINRPDVDHAGLFGTIENADIRNVGLVDVDVNGGYAVGALVAYQAGGSVSNSFVTGTVSGTINVGALVGISESGVLANSYSDANVATAEGGVAGGLVGATMSGSGISNSYFSGTVTGVDSFTGGLLGGDMTGDLVASASFWNTDTAGADGIGCSVGGSGCEPDPATIAGLSTANMRLQASYTGWDFADTWTIHPLVNDGYPYLQWQNVVVPNSPPSLVSAIGNQEATQGSAFSLDVRTHFADVDEDALSFTASGLPASLAMNDGVISGTPTNADALIAEFTVTVTASDDTDSTSDSFTLSVANINDAPRLESAIGNQTGSQGEAFSLDVASHFSDPDEDTLTFSATGLPASFDISTAGVISGTPTNADALNGPYAVTVTATDGTESIGASFQLNVLNVNDAPVLVSAIGNRNATQDSAFSLDISGHFDDPDATELGFSASGLPASLSISSTGTISGTPTNADIANSPYSVTVTATDGTLVATDSFTLTIDNVNDAPGLVSAIGNRNATQGSAFSLDVAAHFNDPDGDTLTFSAGGLPASFGISVAGTISGTPTNADALGSPYTITVSVTDGTASTGDSFTLTIANVNDAPVLVSAIGNHSGTESSEFTLNVASHFSDPDGDVLTFSATGLPPGLGMDAAGLITGTPSAAGSSTVTVTATDADHEAASDSFTLTIDVLPPEPEPEEPQPDTTVIDTSKHDETLSGNIVITENGVLDGGVIDGTIDNRGTITGNVQLAGGASIDGGTVSGSVSGDAAQPAVITNAAIPAGTRLDNVIIGAGTTLDPGVQIGANVRFESDAAIPDAIDLTGALRQLQWADKDARPVPDLDDDVVTDAALSLIRSIQLLPEFELTDSAVSQDAGNGEIVVITRDTRSTVLPVQVSQASADEGEGVYVNDDGDVVFVTGNRRAVLSYPVLVASDALVDALRSLGLELRYDERANLQVTPATTGAQTLMERDGYTLRASALVNADFYYSSRPALEALPAYRFSAPGLYYHTVPGLPNATSLVLVFEDDAGKLLEQELVPVPADWFALKGYLEQLPGARNVRIDAQGIVSLTLNGTTIRGRAGYNVGTGSIDATAGLVLESAGDINGDGTGDYLLHYPNGDVQHLLIYPQ